MTNLKYEPEVAPARAVPTEFPLISVVIPMRNERRHIGRCLTSVLLNDYPTERIEVIVVDGASTDGCKEVVQEFQRNQSNVRLLENPQKVTPFGMNIGLKNARGRYILILSGHSALPSNFLSAAVKCIQEVKADVVGGPALTMPGLETFWSKAIACVRSHKFGVGNSRFRTDFTFRGYVECVPFGLYKRETFDQFGVFDEQLTRNQDNELQSRIRSAGGKIYMCPELTATYFADDGLAPLCSKSSQNGLWNTKALLAGCSGISARHFAPAVFVTLLVLGGVGSLVYKPLLVGVWALMLVYFLAAIAASIQIFATKPALHVLVTPLVFFLYHVSYGTGNVVAFPLVAWRRFTGWRWRSR